MRVVAGGRKSFVPWLVRQREKGPERGESMLTTYEEQIEAGKQIVMEMLAPRVLTFRQTDLDFDNRVSSLLDGTQIIAKIKLDDLADCVADKSVQARLKTQLQLHLKSR
jgi:hypothetical protein